MSWQLLLLLLWSKCRIHLWNWLLMQVGLTIKSIRSPSPSFSKWILIFSHFFTFFKFFSFFLKPFSLFLSFNFFLKFSKVCLFILLIWLKLLSWSHWRRTRLKSRRSWYWDCVIIDICIRIVCFLYLLLLHLLSLRWRIELLGLRFELLSWKVLLKWSRRIWNLFWKTSLPFLKWRNRFFKLLGWNESRLWSRRQRLSSVSNYFWFIALSCWRGTAERNWCWSRLMIQVRKLLKIFNLSWIFLLKNWSCSFDVFNFWSEHIDCRAIIDYRRTYFTAKSLSFLFFP